MEQGTIVVGIEYREPGQGQPDWAALCLYEGVTVRNPPPGVPELFATGDPEADWHAAWCALAPWVLGFAIDTSGSVERFVAATGGWYTFDEDGMLVRSEEAPGALRVAAA